MLKRLRWQLTALYFLAALGLVILIGGGSYALLSYYFRSTTDLALEYKMATLFRSYGAPLPTELAQAEHTWLSEYGSALPVNNPREPIPIQTSARQDSEHSEEEREHSESPREEQYDANLAPIFVIPLNLPGESTNIVTSVSAPLAGDLDALAAAESQGHDWRTVRLPDETPVRLLTYRTGSLQAPDLIQIGRLMSDQARVLNLYLTGLAVLGVAASLGLGVGGWWLSGRSIRPAQRGWEQQQAFVSNASHELRTPLTLIRASADYGLRTEPQGEIAGVLQDIVDESDYMNRLVDDLLLLSRLDAKRFKFKQERISIAELFSETTRQVEKVAADKGVDLQVSASNGVLLGDRTRLRQVLLIFLDNALRFTKPGGRITLASARHGKNMHIIVKDTGEGIAPQHVPHVFERFYQVNPSSGSELRSNGLGLSIAKPLVEAQGGRLELASELGVGTEVTMIFPQADPR